MKNHKRHNRLMKRPRTLAAAMIGLLLLTSMPVQAWAAASAKAAPGPSRPMPPQTRTPIRVNRVVPSVATPALGLVFSPQPTADEIRRARVFEEPLIPIGGTASPKENKALAQALLTYLKQSDGANTSAVTQFLIDYPRSVWRASLLTNLGLVYRRQGYFSKALEALEQAWRLSKHETAPSAPLGTGPEARALADRTAGELAELRARLGHEARLEALLQELNGRTLRGSATEKITAARESLWLMRHRSETVAGCGPYALSRVLASLHRTMDWSRLATLRSSRRGLSLLQLQKLAADVGLKHRMAYRSPGARIPVPAVVHWKVGHYGALVKDEDGRYLVQDPALGGSGDSLWISAEALNAESSGYFLIADGRRPDGWQAVSVQAGARVWGKGATSGFNTDGNKPRDKKVGGGDGDGGDHCRTAQSGSLATGGAAMARYSVHAMLVSLNIEDTPVGYKPPRGPAIPFTVTYNQREANQPANFSYSNLGPKWTFNWLSYIIDDPNSPPADVKLFVQGGGAETYTGFDPGTQSYAPQLESRAVLVRTSPTSYERRLPDGSTEIFDIPDGATTAPRKVFMTSATDPFGNTVALSYDDRFRLTAITDAIGQVTTLAYELLPPNQLKITKVTDPFGRFASFGYDGSGRLASITDVIGIRSAFTYSGSGDFINTLTTPYGTTRFAFGESGVTRFLEATDPLGDTERVEFRHNAPRIPSNEFLLPSGLRVRNGVLNFRNTFYWDKKAYVEAEAGRDDRRDYTKARLLHWIHEPNVQIVSNILESEKPPLENRIWYNYAGQPIPEIRSNTDAEPSKIARRLEDGTTQMYQYAYNRLGKRTRLVDPLGRMFSYIYAPNQIDLLEIRQTRSGKEELLARFTYNSQHRPLTATDAAGQTTRFTYNNFGQLLTVTNARSETTTYSYNDSGYLIRIEGAIAGSTTTYSYDDFGRVSTITDSEGYTRTFDYDNLDRITQITYPDGTTEQRGYDRLDLVTVIDRLGQQTSYSYDALRRLTSIQDALNQTTRFEWCRCGAMKRLIDPRGQRTSWEYDVQGRVTRKVFADGSQVGYRYETATGRLADVMNPNQETVRYRYNADDTVRQISYNGPGVRKAPVAFSYDSDYRRVLTMRDGTGVTTYTYYPITATPRRGAGRLSAIVGPLADAVITYRYDELGRVVRRSVGGVAESVSYDALGRMTQVTNPLGSFGYSYVNTTNRLQAISYPNGQRTTFSYYDNRGDQRLQQIQNLNPAVLSQFNYSYDANGQVQSWIKQLGAQPPVTYTFTYDPTGQLLEAAPSGGIASSYVYQYDPAGNRTTEQVDGALTASSYNNLNQLVNQQAATLPDPNPVPHRSEIEYDGLGRRVRVVEKDNEVVISDRQFVWCDNEICEERDATGKAVTKRFYAQGVVIVQGDNPGNYYYTRDHLGSIREITDASGQLRAQYDYDPYGRVVKLAGDLDGDFGFTGIYMHGPSGLNLALYRAYDPNLGRWTSRDPLGEVAGLNLYAYVENNPVNAVDPFGLSREAIVILSTPVPQPIGGTFTGTTTEPTNIEVGPIQIFVNGSFNVTVQSSTTDPRIVTISTRDSSSFFGVPPGATVIYKDDIPKPKGPSKPKTCPAGKGPLGQSGSLATGGAV